MPPKWHRTSPTRPFAASPKHPDQLRIAFKPPKKIIPRVFRQKEEQELEEVARCANLFLDLSEHVTSVATYIAAIRSWKQLNSTKHADQLLQGRDALQLHGLALCDKMKEWSKAIKESCEEPDVLDTNDYFACRRASQATLIHYGRRLMMSIVLDAWVTSRSIINVNSLYLAKLHREAFTNAREAARFAPLLRTLLSCGTVIKIPWPTLALFNAAVTLAVPLLGLRSTPHGMQGCPHIIRIDELPQIDRDDKEPYTSFDKATQSAVGQTILSAEETRSLAPSILQILEVLNFFKPDLLKDEAKQRLSKLVESFGASSEGTTQLQTQAPSTRHIEEFLIDPSGLDLLDSLVTFDNAWWEHLIAK